LARRVVALETERIKGSNPWSLWWWWWKFMGNKSFALWCYVALGCEDQTSRYTKWTSFVSTSLK
jgi:hypothetical protein